MPNLWKRKPELLLLPNIPQPLHGVNPRTVLGTTWWNKERRRAYASTNYHCEACGIHKNDSPGTRKILDGHEVYDTRYETGELIYIRTTPLCVWCHKYIHDGRLQWLLETGQISHSHFRAVISHGTRVLAEAGLKRPSVAQRNLDILTRLAQGKIASWEKWRLIINGVEYFPQTIQKEMEE